jgi:hypothetical protein
VKHSARSKKIYAWPEKLLLHDRYHPISSSAGPLSTCAL